MCVCVCVVCVALPRDGISIPFIVCLYVCMCARTQDLEFASVMVQTLNMILLTSQELGDLRQSIRNAPDSPVSIE